METTRDRTAEAEGQWQSLWRYVAGVGVCLVLGYFVVVKGTRVPVLGWVDLGFHELGHMIMYPLPVGDMLTAAAGSGLQVLVPLGLALYFLLARRDLLGAGLCAAWAGASLQDVSIYVADAPYQRLPLIGGEHDWAYLLGPQQFGALDQAQPIASWIRGIGILFLFVGIMLCLVGPYVRWRPKPNRRLARLGIGRVEPVEPAHPTTVRQPVGSVSRDIAPGDEIYR